MVSLLATNAIHSFAKRMKNAFDVMTSASLSALCPVEQTSFERSLVKSVSKLYLQVDLICQNRYFVSYQRVPGSIPGRGSIDHFSNLQSWQMRSLPILDPYVCILFTYFL